MGRMVLILTLGAVALAGCGTTPNVSRSSPNVITREQMAGLESMSAYDAIQRLRPTWLQSRGPTSLAGGPTLPRVHINQSPFRSPRSSAWSSRALPMPPPNTGPAIRAV
jgi:hypothetical protein